jgi:hypothetical protein
MDRASEFLDDDMDFERNLIAGTWDCFDFGACDSDGREKQILTVWLTDEEGAPSE